MKTLCLKLGRFSQNMCASLLGGVRRRHSRTFSIGRWKIDRLHLGLVADFNSSLLRAPTFCSRKITSALKLGFFIDITSCWRLIPGWQLSIDRGDYHKALLSWINFTMRRMIVSTSKCTHPWMGLTSLESIHPRVAHVIIIILGSPKSIKQLLGRN